MYKQILNLLIQPILGGAAGYITNEYAINMLFKSYTPLHIGGVIPKTRDEFIANITKLVEEDIVNKDKIQSIIGDSSFIDNFNTLVEDFFNKGIFDVTDNIQVCNIPGFDEFNKSLQSLIKTEIPPLVDKTISYISLNTKIEDIITAKQISTITSNLYDNLLFIMKNSLLVDNLFANYNDNSKETSICDLIGTTSSNVISNNIESIIFDKTNLSNTINNKIDSFINNVLVKTNSYKSINELINRILIKNKDNINLQINNLINNFLTSDKSNELLYNLANCIINYGKNLNICLYELIDVETLNNIKSYIKNNSSEIITFILEFVDKNDKDLLNIINESISETINEQDTSKKAMLSMAKGTIQNKINQFNLKEFLSNILSDDAKLDSLLDTLISKIAERLKSTSVSQLINALIEHDVLNESKFSEFITKYIKSIILNLSNTASFSFKSLINNETVNSIITKKISTLIREKILLSNKMLSNCKDKFSNIISETLNKSLEELIANFYTSNVNINDKLIEILTNKKEFILNTLNSNIANYICNKNISQVIDVNNIEFINTEISNSTKNALNSYIKNSSNLTMHELFTKLNSFNKLHDNVALELRNQITLNLSPILQKFIRSLSETNLNKLSDEELCEMAKSFIGNNLKPIMYFGGMLGIVAGIIIAIVNPNATIVEPLSLVNALTYSLVGFSTNAIAINMLFKPYNEIKFLKKVPFFRHFSLGYIAKNKAILADSMSYGINKYLLSKDSINELFDIYETSIKDNIKANVSENNYEKINNIISNNSDNIVNYLSKKSYDYLISNSSNMTNIFVNRVNKISVSEALYRNKTAVTKAVINYKTKFKNYIDNKASEYIYKNDKISTVINTKALNYVENLFSDYLNSNYDKILDVIDYEKIHNLFCQKNVEYKNMLDKNLTDILTNFDAESISLLLKDKAKNLSSDNEIKDKTRKILINKINTALQSDNNIGSLFEGNASKIANSYLLDICTNIEKSSAKLFVKAKTPISIAIQNMITKNLNFLTKGVYAMVGGPSIIDTTVEKAIVKKLPIYLQTKTDYLYKSLSNILNQKILKSKVVDLGITVNSDLNFNSSDDFSQKSNINIEEFISSSVDFVKEKANDFTIKDLLKPFGLDSIDSIFNNYGTDISKEINIIKQNCKLSRNDLLISTKQIINSIFENTIQSNDIRKVFEGISEKEINYFSNNISNFIFNDKCINNSLSYLFETIDTDDYSLNFESVADISDLSISLRTILSKLISKNDTKTLIKDCIQSLFDEVEKDKFNILDTKSRDYLLEIVTDASILSLKSNLDTILKDIEFDKIVKEQINDMSPKKIHKMFNSFAGKYFRTLMFYGLFGATFGINTLSGLILSGVYGVKNLANSKAKKHKSN
ncbi:DUF445 family protein [Sedimentibacter sp. zth1]|uniref:DUF445 family protein n=1 Tax=Sedimentibacter sp. zth1 TaxID=2816908 RepID=UPI001A90F216|nr:DUF445 family protein [Sedimentibacter sp. zth1]QSX05312.1 DUF445 family protein [Sedimentibacter sp. zth1]